MNKMDCNNPVRRQVFQIPEMAGEPLQACFGPGIRELLETEEVIHARKVILTGAGDSYAAAAAMAPVLAKYSGCLQVQVMRLIEFTRFLPKEEMGIHGPEDCLVVVISAGGGTSRVVEALEKANRAGAFSLLITGKAESPAAKAAKKVYVVKTPPLPTADTPGLCSYFASQMGLSALALCAGRTYKDSFPKGVEWEQRIRAYIKSYEGAVLERVDDQMFHLAQRWKEFERFEFVGDDAEYGSAFFGGAKFVECNGAAVSVDDTEDWCHVNYFLRNPETIGMVVMADKYSPSFGRILETVHSALYIGRPVLIVTNSEADVFEKGAEVCTLPEAPAGFEWLMPLMDYIPAAILAGYITVLSGEPFFRRFLLPEYTPIANTPFANRECFTFSNSKIEIYE